MTSRGVAALAPRPPDLHNIGNVIPTAIVTGTIYVVINVALSALPTFLEVRQPGVRRRRAGADVPVEIGMGRI